MKISILQAHVIDPFNQTDEVLDIHLNNGIIIAIGNTPDGFIPDKSINAVNKILTPGFIDLYANIRDQNGEAKNSELNAALKSGITNIVCPPDQDPIIDNPTASDKFIKSGNVIKLYPLGALTDNLNGSDICDLNALAESGCIAFSNVLKPVKDLQTLKNCYDYAKSFNLKIFIKANEPSLEQNGVMHEGAVSSRLGLKGIPEIAETIAIAQQLLLIEQTGVSAHFNTITCSKSVELIKDAQNKGLPVTADTAMHHLHLTEMDALDFNPNCHVLPPVRSQTDCLGLQSGINEGILSAICSHHKPLSSLDKQAPFAISKPGISSLDTFLSLGLHLVNSNKMNLNTLIHCLTKGPADILGLSNLGVNLNQPANFCIIDPDIRWEVSKENLTSQGHNTPFIGWDLPGKVKYTFNNGDIIYQDAKFS